MCTMRACLELFHLSASSRRRKHNSSVSRAHFIGKERFFNKLNFPLNLISFTIDMEAVPFPSLRSIYVKISIIILGEFISKDGVNAFLVLSIAENLKVTILGMRVEGYS
jgi:hypothetical protein